MQKTRSISSKLLWLLIWLPFAMFSMTGCDTEDEDERAEKDRNKILEYLQENEIDDYYENDSGVFIVIENEGSGGYPHEGSTVRMNYTGYLLDGDVFDSVSGGDVFLPNTVVGFREGVLEFQRGGKGKILIPSRLGYGTSGTGSIPRNAVLIFDLEIIDFF